MEIILTKDIFAHTLNLSKLGMKISSWKTMRNGWHNVEIATLKTFTMRRKDFFSLLHYLNPLDYVYCRIDASFVV